MKKLIVEFIGTFFLVLTVCLTSQLPEGIAPLGAVAVGSVLMVMVYAGGHISGGHFNPAVTLGVWIRGKCDNKDVVPYWITQLVAALAAVAVVCLVLGNNAFNLTTSGSIKWGPTIVQDFIGTFALVWVVLNTATVKSKEGNSFYGLAIGFTVLVCAMVMSGAYNPAVAFGLFLKGGVNLLAFVVMAISALVGGAVAAFTFKYVNGNE